MPSKECRHPTCSGDHCRRTPTVKPKRQPIAKFSKKRAKVNVEYAKKAKAFRQANPYCAVRLPGICTVRTQAVQHVIKKDSIELLMDESNWLPICFACNGADGVEKHDEWARQHGYKKSKFTPINKP